MTTGDDASKTPEEWFGAAVRHAREQLGWTQAELARQMATYYLEKYSHSTVAKTEAGSRPVRLNEATAYAYILRRDLALMTQPPGPPTDLTANLEEIYDSIRWIDSERLELAQKKAQLEFHADDISTRIAWLVRQKAVAHEAEGDAGGVDQEA